MITFLGLPNIAFRGSCFVDTVGDEPTPGEASNLKNLEPKVTARISTYDPLYSWWRVRTYGDFFDLGGLALVNTNISDHGYFRIVSESQEYAGISPTIITNPLNITGTVGNIGNDVSNPDASYVGPTDTNAPWGFTLDFSTTSETARQGTAMGAIIFRVNVFGGDADNMYPSIVINLKDNGVVVRAMGHRAVSEKMGAGGQIFVFPFNPAEIASSPSTLANIQVEMFGYPGDNSSYFKVDTVQIVYDNGDIANAIDSLWVSADQLVFSDIVDGLVPTKSVHYLFDPIHENVESFKLLFLDDGTQINPPLAFVYTEDPGVLKAGLKLNPSGYIEGGVLELGPRLDVIPGMGVGEGPGSSIYVESVTVNSQVGQAYGIDAFTRRDTPKNIELVCNRDQMMQLLFRIGWQKGKTGPFYVIQEPDLDLKYQLFNSFYCVCSEVSSTPIEIGRSPSNNRGDDVFIVTLRLTEKS